jgi:hypothetical protein
MVQTELVPPSLLNGTLRVVQDDKTTEVFAKPVPQALVADGKVFTFRGAGDRLVGTLQLSTVRNNVHLTNPDERNHLVDGILPNPERITVGTVEVAQSATSDKSVYVWFSDRQFQVLQLKPSKAVPFKTDDLLAELIGYQTSQPSWKPLQQPGIDTTNGEEEDPG